MAPEITLALALVIGLIGAGLDIRSRRIPNWIVLAMAGAAVSATYLGFGVGALGTVATHSAIALVVGMVLFALRMIGAGDAKFYAAAALAIPLDRAIPMLGWVALSALVLVAFLMIWYRGLKITRGGEKRSWTLPYGVPIFCGFAAESLQRFDIAF